MKETLKEQIFVSDMATINAEEIEVIEKSIPSI